ncbi:hypothetical protein [Mycolicibacterium conceptionense]|uniref:hypothetical protein n=1 Tax=Mycolicibacterium conceptionense TaxID=451644 RepID=UPI00096E7C7E|nr:hypothetical protein [Mycolicibacterium conceptionense]OMB79228.1 hypothetical protein A5743_14070 [Mycolicibacterium conceptionense]
MSTQELTYEIAEGEDGKRLVATIDIPERDFPLQVGVAVHVVDAWVVILWDERVAQDQASASFKSEDRATALQVLDFHAALVTRLVAAQAVPA